MPAGDDGCPRTTAEQPGSAYAHATMAFIARVTSPRSRYAPSVTIGSPARKPL